MLSVIYALVVTLNLVFLTFAILQLGPLFVVYFAATQAVVVYLLFDHLKGTKTKIETRKNLFDESKSQSPSIDKASTSMQRIQFEPTEKLNFESSEPAPLAIESRNNENSDIEIPAEPPRDPIEQTFEDAPSSQKFYFLKKTFDDQNKSQLEMLDQLLVKIPKQKRSLIVTNLYTTTKNSKNFEGFLWGQGLESEIICNEIQPGIDLIPHLGSLENCPESPTADYFAGKALDYDQIVFYLIETELSGIQRILSTDSEDDTEISNFQQIQL